jgi:hypothetical protein
MASECLKPNISVKLTILIPDLEDDLAHDNLAALLNVADGVDEFVRTDMEGSASQNGPLASLSGCTTASPVAPEQTFRPRSNMRPPIWSG